MEEAWWQEMGALEVEAQWQIRTKESPTPEMFYRLFLLVKALGSVPRKEGENAQGD